jgi:hypothetical protein
MSIITKTLHAFGESHFWVEIEHLGAKVEASVKSVVPVSDIVAEVTKLHDEAVTQLNAYKAAYTAYKQATAAAGQTPAATVPDPAPPTLPAPIA